LASDAKEIKQSIGKDFRNNWEKNLTYMRKITPYKKENKFFMSMSMIKICMK